MSTHVTARPRRGRAAAHVLGPHPGVGELGGPSSFSVGALSAQPAAPWAAVPTLTPCRDGGRLWRPAIPLWGVPGAGWLPYRSTSPPSGRTRRCLTTSVLALELKVMPVSFPHVFLHVSLSQSSNMSPRKRQCGEGRPHSGPGADRAAGGGRPSRGQGRVPPTTRLCDSKSRDSHEDSRCGCMWHVLPGAGQAGVMLPGAGRPDASSSCAHGPRRTSTAAEGALKDVQGHHLTQGPPNGHRTVGLPWASHVNGSCRLKVLLATGAWKDGRSMG